jgi:hypothetical protein
VIFEQFIRDTRNNSTHFDLVQFGTTSGNHEQDRESLSSYARVGATWWVESIEPAAQLGEVRRRIRRGPPSVDASCG